MMALNRSAPNRLTVLAVAVFFRAISTNIDLKWRPNTNSVQLTSDSPTTLGGTTTFFAQALDCGPGGLSFRFSFTYFERNISIVNSSYYTFSISNWKSIGEYEVTVDVERIKPYYKYCGRATTLVIITGTITASLKTNSSGEDDYNIGPVFLSVNIHDPSHMFSKATYFWDFGDGSYINNTQLGELSHNFTEVKTYCVKVVIFAMAKGKEYSGTAYKNMKFNGGFLTHVIVTDSNNMSTLRLPSSDRELLYVSLGYQMQFIVLYNNPYSIVQKCYAQWSIQGAGNRCNLKHTFIKKGKTYIYITPTLGTRHRLISQDPIQKKLFVEEPISGLTLERKNYTLLTTYLEANISCNGGAPFKMCWTLSMYSSSFGDPLIENCTGLSATCRFHINRRTISYKGRLELDITVMNRVGYARLVEQFSIPKPAPHHHHSAEKTTIDVIVPIVVCLIIAAILIYIIRKVYKIRHRSVLETANFDFRDEDNQSVDSLVFKNKCFTFFKFWKKNQKYYPLLENWEKQPSYSSVYSDIL